MPAYIQGRNVNLTFRPPNRGPVRALQGFDIEVYEGEFLSVVGPSGCGKSTFLNVLLGLIKPDSGELTLNGRRISGPGTDRAMVFQEFGLLPWRTVQHNIELGLELKGVAVETRRSISARFVDMVGLAGFEGHYPHELSGGMKQRVGTRPRARHRSRRAADGRAVRRARCPDPRPHAGRAAAHLAGGAQDGAVRHPPDRRGDLSLRPGDGDDQASRAAPRRFSPSSCRGRAITRCG